MDTRIVFYILASVYLIIMIKSYAVTEEEIEFSYQGNRGPENWGTLCPSCSICSNGKLQSPINIVKDKVVLNNKLLPLMRLLKYSSSNASLVNTGELVKLKFLSNAGFLVLDGKNYALKEVIFHTPSEHQIDGVKYDAELQVVNVAEDGTLVIVAALYRYALPDPLLVTLTPGLIKLVNQDEVPVGILPTPLFAAMLSNKYYKYIGSSTTPPCKENVIWLVVSQVRSISRSQVQALKAPLDPENKNNARPLQPLNNRTIETNAIL